MYWITLLTISVGLIIIIIFMPSIARAIVKILRAMDKLWDLEETWLEKRKERKR